MGDQTIIARVTSLGNTNGWAKAGVMFRDSVLPVSGGGSAAGAICVDLVATPSNGVSLQWRSATGGASSSIQAAGVAAPTASHPVWLKLVKNGSNYAGYYSSNGPAWTEVGSTVVTLSNVEYLAGLAVASHNNGTLTTATFDNVERGRLPAGRVERRRHRLARPGRRGQAAPATSIPSPAAGPTSPARPTSSTTPRRPCPATARSSPR